MGATCSQSSAVCTGGTGSQPKRKYTWRPDISDHRDYKLMFTDRHKAILPPKVDLRSQEHFPIYNQGFLGSCTANALGAAFHFDQIRQGLQGFTPSRLFIYYNERAMEGNINVDAGAFIRDGAKSLCTYGVCNEVIWPYDESKFNVKPPPVAYQMAAKHRAKAYARVPQTLQDMKACLNSGAPFAFGFSVFMSFESVWTALTGHMTMPCSCCDALLGGHAVLAVGYDDEKQVFIVRNSWTDWWGDKGYFYMPYAYITNPEWCDDFWAIGWVNDFEFPHDNGGLQPAPARPSSCLASWVGTL